MNRLRRHFGLLALLAIAAPLTFAFCWHAAVLPDDSMSYIVIARWISPFAHDPLSAPWIGYLSNFPPVFPLLLALTGGAWNFLVGHLVVAACSIAALVLVYAYGVSRFGKPLAGFGLAAVFLAMPTAWISIVGILSEPLFLAISLAAILAHERRDPRRMRDSVLLGLLLSAALLTRLAGAALFAAYAVHVAIRALGSRKWPDRGEIVALLMPVAAEFAWLAVRPQLMAPGYQSDAMTLLQFWVEHPAYMADVSAKVLNAGWVGSFTADASGPLSLQVALWAVAALALAGVVRGAMRNRLDSWYTMAGLAILYFWVYGEDNQRRLLYPLIPLLLAHAGEMLADLARHLGGMKAQRAAMLAGAALVALVCAPAMLLVAQKATHRTPVWPGSEYSLSAMTDYYSTVNLEEASILGWVEAAGLAGLRSVERVTPPDAHVMWTRPEYVAVLGRRAGVPFYFAWTPPRLARELLASGTTHVVATHLIKVDLDHHSGNLMLLVRDTPAYLHAVEVIPNPTNGAVEFVLFEVDREAVARAVAADAPR